MSKVDEMQLWDRIRALEAKVEKLTDEIVLLRQETQIAFKIPDTLVYRTDIHGRLNMEQRSAIADAHLKNYGDGHYARIGLRDDGTTIIQIWRRNGIVPVPPEAAQNTEAPSTGGDQQPEQRQDPLRWGGSREVPHSSRVLPYEGGTG